MLRRAGRRRTGTTIGASSWCGWRAATASRATPTWPPTSSAIVLEGQTARLSAAALETLAIVAYKQPVSRAQMAAIRGVNVDGVIRTLSPAGFVAEVGRDPGPGQAVLYGTTALLLERLGLDRIEELPPLAQFVPGPEIMDALEHSGAIGSAGGGQLPVRGREC